MREDLAGEAGSRQKRPAISVDVVSDPVEILDDDTESDRYDEKRDSPPPSSGLLDLHAAATAAEVMNPIPYQLAKEMVLAASRHGGQSSRNLKESQFLCIVESALELNPEP